MLNEIFEPFAKLTAFSSKAVHFAAHISVEFSNIIQTLPVSCLCLVHVDCECCPSVYLSILHDVIRQHRARVFPQRNLKYHLQTLDENG